MSSEKSLDIKSLINKAVDYSDKLRKYGFLSFIVFVAIVYGFVLYRINSLQSMEPTENEITSQVEAARIPKIDEDIVKQLKSLEDNSVSVKALFNEARSNPFDEE